MPTLRVLSLSLALLCTIAACGTPETETRSVTDRSAAATPPAAQPAVQTAPIAPAPPARQTLAEARRGFVTQITTRAPPAGRVPEPPPAVFSLVHYPAPVGRLAAYVTPDPRDGERYPAMIWMTGGDSNSIGPLWEDAPRDNDQTAAAFRRAGIVLMFPSLRGGNDNPGLKEGFLGEVDDILAAADWLDDQPYVDPQRIYLGGHSTGGTLVMLVAEQSDRFRATFAFGPVADIAGYGPDFLYFDAADGRELRLRSPSHWLHGIRTPTFVFEGRDPPSNLDALEALQQAAGEHPLVHFHAVAGTSHFSILAPLNERIATKILLDTGAQSGIRFAPEDFAFAH